MSPLEQISLSYTGKIPKRKDGIQRRNEILAAALRLIARHGIREIRHRAVAKEANVPLSATTYYFEDINSLIHDAHVYYQESSIGEVQTMADHGFAALESYHQHGDTQQLRDDLEAFLTQYILQQVSNKDARMVEWSFRQEVLRETSLTTTLYQPRKLMLDTITGFFRALAELNGEDESISSAKASIFMGTISQLEYQLLADSHPSPENFIRQTFQQLLKSMIATAPES